MPDGPQVSNGAPDPLRVSQIIWGALTIAPIVYCVVSYLVRPGDLAITLPDLSDPIRLFLTLSALGTLVAGFVVPGVVAAFWRRQFSASAAPDPRRAPAEQQVMIVRGALFEAVAIYGFVMVQMGGPASQVIPFAVVSLTLLLLYFPTRERLAEPFEE